jgi:vacuolar protein sorting-associated protein VTA1
MPLEIPPELKKIAPYIKRAEELDRDTTAPESRLVAYYLRQYAVQLGIPLASGSSPAAKTCLGAILGDLEIEKSKMDNFTRDEAAFLCRKFALNVFNKADNEDRAGLAGKGTAKTFYAAQSFLQMLDQFATENDESEQVVEDKKRILYCKWKATEILKAIKEGREPTPGGYGDDVMDSMGEETIEEPATSATEKPLVQTIVNDDDDFGLPVAPTKLPPPPLPPVVLPPPNSNVVDETAVEQDEEGMEVALGPPPAYTAANTNASDNRPALAFNLPPLDVPPPATKSKSPSLFGTFMKKNEKAQTSKAQLADAIELTKFALAALEDRDGDLAAERLRQALSALGR